MKAFHFNFTIIQFLLHVVEVVKGQGRGRMGGGKNVYRKGCHCNFTPDW